MTDRELLENAAKAAGIELRWALVKDPTPRAAPCWDYWNPINCDGDSLRLAVKLRLCVDCVQGADVVIAFVGGGIFHSDIDITIDDRLAATRRAIVRAAAEIGKAA